MSGISGQIARPKFAPLNTINKRMWWYWLLVSVGVVLLISIYSLLKPFQRRVSFVGKNVIITGGSAGIGKELSIMIAKENIGSITILARTQSKLDEVSNEISSYCDNVLTISCDVANKDSVKEAIDESVAKFGIPDILITCAGLSTPGYFLEQDVDIAEHTMQVDFFGTFYASHRAAHHMAKRSQGGHIVMISSTLAALGVVGFSSYCPAKYALKGLAEVLRTELSPYNIRISLVYPPDTQTAGYARENLTKPADCLEIIAGIKKGDFHIAVDFFTKVFVALSNSISPRQFGPLEVLIFPVFAILGFVTRLLNDSIVMKHYKKAKQNKSNSSSRK